MTIVPSPHPASDILNFPIQLTITLMLKTVPWVPVIGMAGLIPGYATRLLASGPMPPVFPSVAQNMRMVSILETALLQK